MVQRATVTESSSLRVLSTACSATAALPIVDRLNEGQMREVQQVVDDQLVVAVDVEIGALVAPVVGALPRIRHDQALVGQRGVAHPIIEQIQLYF